MAGAADTQTTLAQILQPIDTRGESLALGNVLLRELEILGIRISGELRKRSRTELMETIGEVLETTTSECGSIGSNQSVVLVYTTSQLNLTFYA